MASWQPIGHWLRVWFERFQLLHPAVKRSIALLWEGGEWCYRLVRQVVRQALDNQISSAASEMAFNAMLSLFPALLLVIASIRQLGTSEPVQPILLALQQDILPQVVPEGVTKVLDQGVKLTEGADQQIFSFGVIALLWLASGFLSPVIRALNNSYRVPFQMRRPWWLNRLFAIAIFVGTVGMIAISSLFAVVLPLLLQWPVVQMVLGEWFGQVWQIVTWPIAIGSIVFALAFLYRVAPAQQPAFAPVWPGAIAGGAIWLAVSVAFRFYVGNFGRYEAIYGSIGAVIVLLLWLYLSAFGILLGGEVNAAIHQLRLRRIARMSSALSIARHETTIGESSDSAERNPGDLPG
jgi:membrane protein